MFRPSLVLGLVLVGLGALLFFTPPPPRADDEFMIEPRQGDQLGAWMNPQGTAGGWTLEGGNVLQNHAVFRYLEPTTGARVTLELHHRDAVPLPALTTAQFSLRGAAPPELVNALGTRLRAEEASYRWIESEQHPTPAAVRRLRQLQLPIAWFLVAQSPLWLLLAGRRAFGQLAGLSRPLRRVMLGALGAAMLARWLLAPLGLKVLYMGYRFTFQELTLEALPRYGAAVAVFHHVLLRAFAADHLTVLRAHSLLGVLMVPLVGALVQAWTRRPGAAIAAAFLWALVPAFISHDNSEANTVPLLFWMAAGLLLWLEARESGSTLALVGSAALLSLAIVGRPEFPVLVPAAMVGLAIGSTRPSRLSPWAWLPLAIAAGVLAVPHLIHVAESAALLDARDSLPLGRSVLGFNRISVLDPSVYPLGLVPFALAALWLRESRRAAAVLLGLALLGFVLTWVDLDPANFLRVQVPGAFFYVLAVALGVATAFERLSKGATGVACLVVAVSVLPCLPASFGRTNEDEEEAFIREAVRALPENALLVRLDYGDLNGSLNGSPVHLHFPDYLFGTVRGVTDWLRDRSHPTAYFYLGTRCYTPEHPAEAREAPEEVPLREKCRELLEQHTAGPVVERVVQSHGDPARTGFYGTAVGRPMRLGLYRLRSEPR